MPISTITVELTNSAISIASFVFLRKRAVWILRLYMVKNY